MTIDLDDLERMARPLTWQEPDLHQSYAAKFHRAVTPIVVLALIERIRAHEAYEDDAMRAQEAAGLSARRASEAIAVLAGEVAAANERVRAAEQQCTENATLTQQALERDVLGRARNAKLEARIRELEAAAVPRCGCGATASVRGDPECDGCGKDCYYCTYKANESATP